MAHGPRTAATVGVSAGLVLVVATLAVELVARGLPLRGGLLQLQLQSVAVWVVEALPLMLGLAGWWLGDRSTPDASVHAPSVSALPAPAHLSAAPPPPPGLPGPTATPAFVPRASPPPVPGDLQKASLASAPADAGSDGSKLKALQELAKRLRFQAERAARESRTKSGLMASLGEEVRGPLNAIVGSAELLLEEDGDGDRADDLKRMSVAGRRLLELLAPVIDLARVETGQLKVLIEDVDLAQVFDEVRAAARPLVDASGGVLSLRVVPGARMVRADHGRLREVLLAVLGLALDPRGGGVQVQVTADHADGRRDGAISIGVRCIGLGLSRSQLEASLDPYQAAAGHGVAVGLTVSRQLVELMGGGIEIAASGDAIEVRLRLREAAQKRELRPRSTLPLNERLAGMRMLVLDPDALGRTLAHRLQRTGVEVTHLLTDDGAVDAVRGADVLIADVGVDGAWAVVEATMDDGTEVVAVSLRDQDVEPALQLGVTAFLTKPYPIELMIATLERCIEPD
jgi:signal transduction histidine kinase